MMDCPFNNLCEKYKEYAPVVLRVVVGLLFAVHGYQKLTLMGVDAFAGMLAGMGIPLAGVMAWVVILTEVIGGIALVLGIGSRHFSTLLAIIMTVAILKVKLVKGWGLHKIVSPSNNNLEASNYVVARFFDSMSDIYNMMDQTNPMSKSMQVTMKNISDLRKIKRSQVLSLVLSER